MIYSNPNIHQRHRILSNTQNNQIKSPTINKNICTPPTQLNHSSQQKQNVVNNKYHRYKPIGQVNLNQTTHYIQNTKKYNNPIDLNKTMQITSSIPVLNKQLTLRDHFLAKMRNEAVQQYNIWDGYKSQVQSVKSSVQKKIQIPTPTPISTMFNSPKNISEQVTQIQQQQQQSNSISSKLQSFFSQWFESQSIFCCYAK